MSRIGTILVGLLLFTSCVNAGPITKLERTDLAPTGTLRVGINIGNLLLTSKDPSNGRPRGIAFDLAEELGK